MNGKHGYPIILAHGITRPDYLIDFIIRKLNLHEDSRVADRLHYFKGIASHLRRHGYEVFATSVSFAADVDTRARELAAQVRKILAETGQPKVHLIGHSMGGLDARHMIVQHGMADQVASLTTLGTPHLGASVADWFLEFGLTRIIESLRKVINLEGFQSLTTAACREFNASARNAEASNSVIYQTYAGWQRRELTFFPFQKTWQITYAREGDNDGLVAVTSQRWQDRLVADDGTTKLIVQRDFPVPADHVNQMGWWHLNGVAAAHWWKRGTWREKRNYELAIKNAYLKIAAEISGFPCHEHEPQRQRPAPTSASDGGHALPRLPIAGDAPSSPSSNQNGT
ncbi:alpha/beta fold hydrolase [candidate division KSB1 bacterium]|nr:alpha/beta fold hydrolase [bacterium]NUM67653.1 alpha/beta fold hydrolase [candidate division KSB1 bacterium]